MVVKLQFRKYGNTGVKVSALGFGAMRLSTAVGNKGKKKKEGKKHKKDRTAKDIKQEKSKGKGELLETIKKREKIKPSTRDVGFKYRSS